MTQNKKVFELKKEIFAIGATFLFIGVIVLFAPHIMERYRQRSIFNQQFVSGTVVRIIENNIEEDPFVDGRYIGNQKLLVRINEGKYQGQEFESSNTLSSLRSAVAYEGLTAIFTIRMDKNDKPVVWIYNYNRTPFVYALVIVLSVLVIIVGAFKGVRSLLALLFTGVMLLYVTVPGMWTPHPMCVAICSLSVVCVVSFILIAGFTKKAAVATIGTVAGILLAGFLTYVLGKIMNLSGVDMEKGETLLYLAQNRNFKISSLLFVSILISCLGATMDIAVSIASSAEQLYIANPMMPLKQYFASIMAVGRDIIGTMTNTLILAFCGGSLPLAMMIWGYHMEYAQFINIPIIVIKILQALAGSIGMVASVIFTALLAVMVFRRGTLSKK